MVAHLGGAGAGGADPSASPIPLGNSAADCDIVKQSNAAYTEAKKAADRISLILQHAQQLVQENERLKRYGKCDRRYLKG